MCLCTCKSIQIITHNSFCLIHYDLIGSYYWINLWIKLCWVAMSSTKNQFQTFELSFLFFISFPFFSIWIQNCDCLSSRIVSIIVLFYLVGCLWLTPLGFTRFWLISGTSFYPALFISQSPASRLVSTLWAKQYNIQKLVKSSFQINSASK